MSFLDISEFIVDHDLRIDLASELEWIRENSSIQPPWPAHDELEALVSIAQPLSVYAATICRHIFDGLLRTPQDLLKDMIKSGGNRSASSPSAIYRAVLDRLATGHQGSSRKIVLQKFRLVVGTVVTLIDPLPKASIAQLIDMPMADVDEILDYLDAMLKVPGDTASPIQFHLSFRDFLFDKVECDADFWIDDKTTHARIATRCIEIMSTEMGLREDICELKHPGKRRSELASETIFTYIPTELRYACRYWANHLQGGRWNISDEGDVHSFLQQHFLHPPEAPGLLGKISEAIPMVVTLQSLLSVRLDHHVIRLYYLTISRPAKAYSVQLSLKMLGASYWLIER